MYDMHTHTVNSHDGRQTVDELCQSAVSKGLGGVAITDHADIYVFEQIDTYNRIRRSMLEADEAREKYGGKLEILKGIELAEYSYDPVHAKKLMSLTDYDVILGSVHSIVYEGKRVGFANAVLDESVSQKTVEGRLAAYLENAAAVAGKDDIDVMCHITYPLRYICGKYKRSINTADFDDYFREIFKSVIERGISLEVNTSGLGKKFNELIPEVRLLKMYADMGGKMVTLGSDAHMSQNIANGFEYAVCVLKDIGFKSCFAYRRRKPFEIKL